ncbi:MAG: transcriptional regulator NrdR [Actinobacteria bacterium]|nr:transcriptional regulator NrdR [Actinomycetota bacterium]
MVDSRVIEEGRSIRRRRECLSCHQLYTTFERVEEGPLWVEKRSGEREVFERSKLLGGISAALKNRPISEERVETLVNELEDSLRLRGSMVKSSDVGALVLSRLRELDKVGYLRFASVHKYFEEAEDFEREVAELRVRRPEE